jgi:hypothetical protein
VRLAVTLALAAVVLLGCDGGGTSAKKWCELHLAAVGAVGVKQGSEFDFGPSRPAIGWPEFVADSAIARSIILAESLHGRDAFDAACREAFAAS